MPDVSVEKTPERISGMFDAIAPRYDLLNRVLSAGIDRYWRTRAIHALRLAPGGTLLDVCCGTADVALQARKAASGQGAARVVGVDFSAAMLKLGNDKVRAANETGRITLTRGDAMRLPAPTASAAARTACLTVMM
mgnify:CR=1 FL=1